MHQLWSVFSLRNAFLLCCLLLFIGSLQAQTGSITGTVQNKLGAVVPRAQVTLIDQERAGQRNMNTTWRASRRQRCGPIQAIWFGAAMFRSAASPSRSRSCVKYRLRGVTCESNDSIYPFSLVGSCSGMLNTTALTPMCPNE